MVVNRIADLFFTVGIVATYYVFQTVEFNVVFGLAPYLTNSLLLLGGFEVNPLVLIVGLLFLGAMGKSAQIGLHTWLPDAMEGPTPVSALIHAATMVTAGVFLLIRCSPLLTCTPSMLTVITVVGAGTAFMAATSGIFQNDLKKVIAYSTCSQLGYMVFVCGLSGYAVSLFHLSTHAFFKALLFLGAGAVIHAVVSEQDMRRFGGLLKLLPYTYAAFLVGSLALMGVPFLSGFYSKDFILELAGSSLRPAANFAYMLGLISALFTSYYSFRLLYLTFYGASRTERTPLEHTHELSTRMAFALFILTVGSVFLGVYGKDLFVGFGADTWGGAIISPAYTTLYHISAEALPTSIKLTPLFLSVTATTAVFLIFMSSSNSQPMFLNDLARQGHYFLTHK
jgi:proton-translocating NADH-quinone oxidoreductase chain L